MRMLELTMCFSADIVTWWQVLFQDNPSSGFVRTFPRNVATFLRSLAARMAVDYEIIKIPKVMGWETPGAKRSSLCLPITKERAAQLANDVKKPYALLQTGPTLHRD